MSTGNYEARQMLIDHNQTVACCAADLSRAILREVLGKSVSKSVSGSVLKDAALTGLITTNLKNELKV